MSEIKDLPLHVSGNNNVFHINFYVNYSENNNGTISSSINFPGNKSNTVGDTAAKSISIQNVKTNEDKVKECLKAKDKAREWAKKNKAKFGPYPF